jgi:hypothetical protein
MNPDSSDQGEVHERCDGCRQPHPKEALLRGRVEREAPAGEETLEEGVLTLNVPSWKTPCKHLPCDSCGNEIAAHAALVH